MSSLHKEPRKQGWKRKVLFSNRENSQVDKTFSKSVTTFKFWRALLKTFKFSGKSPDYCCFCENVWEKNAISAKLFKLLPVFVSVLHIFLRKLSVK
jgi:hypothetical protein